MITFGNPAAAYLFLIIPLITLLIVFGKSRTDHLIGKWISKILQPRLVISENWTQAGLRIVLWNSIIALIIVALMDPRGNPHYLSTQKKLEKPVKEVIILIDASASMLVNDSRTGQTRFDIAKDIAQQTIEHLAGNSISLDAFTSTLVPLSPPTFDLLFIHLMLNELQINEGDLQGHRYSLLLRNYCPRFPKQILTKL